MQKVLQGLRVLEIGGLGPGPFCAMHLADLGADVISLVRPAAVAARPSPAICSMGQALGVRQPNRPEGRDLALQLVRNADADEGMRPAAGAPAWARRDAMPSTPPCLQHDRLGPHGSLAHTAGHDANYAALSGAMGLQPGPMRARCRPWRAGRYRR